MVYPATNEDWEDIAVGPCGNTSCIYISDKAANIIYRVAEPEFVYSDQILSVDSKVGIEWHHDRPNTLMVDNKGQAYIIASIKGGRGRVGLVKLQDWGHSGVRIDTDVHLNVPGNHQVTDPQSGDVSADGQQVLILMKNHVFFWNVINDDVLQTLSHAPEHVRLPHEGQGSEGVCFDATGRNYYTVEQKEDAHLYFYEREIPFTHSVLG